MVSPAVAAEFASKWVAAWNAHDLESILAHYADDFEMRSPLIVERGFSADGVLRGKAAIRPYWAAGLSGDPALRFELLGVYTGVGAIALHYRSHAKGKLVVERIELGPDGKGYRAEALYRDDPAQ